MPTRDEKNHFSELIILRAEKLRTDHMDAIITYCEEVGLEMEVAAGLVNETLRARLAEEAEALNIIEKSGRLPL
jgi:hypothetical protein